MTTVEVTTLLNATLTGVSTAMPEFFAAYSALKLIWTIANPGKTDADWSAFLATNSSKTTSDSDAILIAKGYVRDPATGNWALPA